jgi:putative tryptophan/tyrosine transport system substrate-binding protein
MPIGQLPRREFIAVLGGTVSWSLAARGQGLPIIGYLSHGTPEGTATFVEAVRKGLSEAGIVDGRDVTSELRWARHDVDRLPGLAADLVQRRVAVIITLDTVPAARAAKAATTQIPIVFTVGTDPVHAGLVASLSRPGGNVTGISTMNLDLGSKWVGLLHQLLPAAKRLAVLVNISNSDSARSLITGTQTAALTLGLQTEFVFASIEGEIDAALAGLGARAQALIIHPDILFTQHRERLAALALREKLSALYSTRNFPQAGGLMSYGSSFLDAHRQAGAYAARILKGEKPGELPAQRATKFELVINLKTARALGLEVPPTLLATADEVIE